MLPGGDGETLLQAPEVLEHQGVVPELQHVVIPEAEAQHDDGGRQEGGPGAAIEAEEEKGQDHHRGKIQKNDPGVAEVAEEDRQAIGPHGVEKAQKAQGAAPQEEPEKAPPEPVPEGGEGIFRQNLIQGKVSFAGDSRLARRGFRRRPRTWPGSRPAVRRSGSRRGRRWPRGWSARPHRSPRGGSGPGGRAPGGGAAPGPAPPHRRSRRRRRRTPPACAPGGRR